MTNRVTVRLGMTGFWPGVSFRDVTDRLVFLSRKFEFVHDQVRPQFLLFGPYVGLHWQTMMPSPPDLGVPTIFMTGENVAPDMTRCDFAVSFSRDIDNPRHVRMPNWVWRLYAEGLSPYSLLAARRRVLGARRRFCTIVDRNSAPNRKALVEALKQYGSVDTPSAALSEAPRVGETWSDKMRFLQRYRFAIAFEKASSRGYTTGKLPDALVAGCVPIYWGDPDVGLDFNPDAFLDLSRFDSTEALADAVQRMEADPRLRWAMQDQSAYVDDRVPDCANEDLLFDFWERVFLSN